MKRKKPQIAPPTKACTPKRRRISEAEDTTVTPGSPTDKSPSGKSHARNAIKLQSSSKTPAANGECGVDSDGQSESPTPRANGASTLRTPRHKKVGAPNDSITRKKADKSAKKKSVQILVEQNDSDDSEGEADLARDILDENGGDLAEEDTITVNPQDPPVDADVDIQTTNVETPSRKRGRPKGSKTRRSPTPEGDLPPEERYFWQTRPGPPQVSSNSLASLKLLTHEEYFGEIKKYNDPHEPEKTYLMKLHTRSFSQWHFELSEGYSLCLYGYGSKRALMNQFAEWLHRKSKPSPLIVVVNGYTPKLSIRNLITTIASAVIGQTESLRLVGQPQEMLDTFLAFLSSKALPERIILMINSIDGPSLRRSSAQNILARLAAQPGVSVVASADTPTHSLLWNSTLKDQFNFVFHDCTTYSPYEVEFSVVDDVNELLGRKGRRMGGKEGIGFVLKSLPENAQNLYRVLLTEVLAILTDGSEGYDQDEFDMDEVEAPKRRKGGDEEVGVEYRALYQKATEEFICSSDMNFRFLLKEFHDHQMITSRRDAAGTELLGVPLTREDIEGVLEDLVMV